MKLSLIVLLLFSLNTFANTRLTLEEQKAIVEKIAKQERRQLHISRHDDVASTVSHLSVSDLNIIMKADKDSYEPLDGTEISYIYGCVSSPKVCTLFTIVLSSSFMSGSGAERIWILMNPNTGRFEKIQQTVYSE